MILSVHGQITAIDLMKNTITIRKKDGAELTLKATTEKTQAMLKNLKVGDKVEVLYTKSGEDLIIQKILKSKAKEKEKQEKK